MTLGSEVLCIIFAFLVQILVFHDIPNMISILGFMIISICFILLGIQKMFAVKSENPLVRGFFCLPKYENSDENVEDVEKNDG